jgi:hypothetical protein
MTPNYVLAARHRYAARALLVGLLAGTIAGSCGVRFGWVLAGFSLVGFVLTCWIVGKNHEGIPS